jgi:porphobilinogen synthase
VSAPHTPAGSFPQVRPRRLRGTPAMRRLVAETRLHPAELVLPMFIREGTTEAVPISSMPGVQQHSLDSFRRALVEAAEVGIGGVNLFGVPEHKDATGTGATDPDGVLNVAIRVAAAEVGDALVVQSDLCLDEFTDHGHCGVLADDGSVDNDATLERYRDMAVVQAEAGAELVCMSGMMDGQIAAAREALDAAGHTRTGLLAYAAKYASAFYGPFREAVASTLVGDRRTYQIDSGNGREGLREVELDVAEGADIVMVKPAMSYLDVLAAAKAISPVPVWAYQISGEYAMISAAAQNGWIDRDAAAMESVLGIKRAGADAILTYFAVDLATRLREESGTSGMRSGATPAAGAETVPLSTTGKADR